MPNYAPCMETTRELVIRDREKIASMYCPPPVCKMRYWILDKQLHACYYYRNKVKYHKALRRFKKEIHFETRFILSHSK